MIRPVTGHPSDTGRVRRRGVTLVEALATVVVLGIVLPGLMYALSLCTRVSGLARQKAQATTLADTKLNELVATGEWQNGALAGDFGEDAPGFTWQASVGDWDQSYMSVLSVDVSWPDRDQPRSVTVSTLVYDTAAAQAATQSSSSGSTGSTGTGGSGGGATGSGGRGSR